MIRLLVLSMKVSLINTDFHSGGPENIVGTLPPLGLLYIGGALKNSGFDDVELIDLCKDVDLFKDDAELGEHVSKKQPSIALIGGMASTASLPRSLAIARAIKAADAEVKVVLGGTHATFMYADIMKNHPEVDFIVRGEGENTASKLLRALDDGGDVSGVKNLVWRTPDNGMKANEIDHEMVDMNECLPAWDLIDDWDAYRSPINGEISAVVQFSRGCDHKCTFCGQWMFWKKWHARSAESFVEEIEGLYTKHGVTFFFWADENPAQDHGRWLELLNRLEETNRASGDYHHMLNLRVDDVIGDEGRLGLYKRAGIIAVDMGMESALQKRLDDFNKGTTTEQNKRALDLLRENDIISIVQVLVGSPDETRESLLETNVRIKEWNPDLLNFYYITPFPWTRMGREQDRFIVERDLAKWDYRHPVIKPEKISMEEMQNICNWFKFVIGLSLNIILMPIGSPK